MDCRTRRIEPSRAPLPLAEALHAAERIAALEPPLALGLARTLASGTFGPLLELEPEVANLVADAADLIEEALARLAEVSR